jgi:hypothetical protein
MRDEEIKIVAYLSHEIAVYFHFAAYSKVLRLELRTVRGNLKATR